MKHFVSVTVMLGSLFATSSAFAQQAPAPATPPAAPETAPTIEITAAPPPPVYPAPMRPPPGFYPPGTYGEDESAQPPPIGAVRGRRFRPPPEPDSPAAIEHSWSRHLAAGFTVGFGSPAGVLGVFADLNSSRRLGFTLGAGIGGSFGPAIALGVNFRPLTLGRWAPYVGAGFSANFTYGEWTNSPSISCPSTSWWFNPEVGFEHRGQHGFFVRLGVGATVLLNTGDFTNRVSNGWYGPAGSNTVLGLDPIAASDAHDQGHALVMFQTHIDLGGLFNL